MGIEPNYGFWCMLWYQMDERWSAPLAGQEALIQGGYI